MTNGTRATKALVRRYEAQDADRVASLRMMSFPGWPEAQDAAWHSSIYRWLETSPYAGSMHRWVASVGDDIVGHLAAVPLPYRVSGQRIIAHTPTDFMSAPGHGFTALSLMRTFFRTCEDYVACDSAPEAMAVERRFGAVEVGDLQNVIKVMDLGADPGSTAPVRRIALATAAQGARAVDAVLTRASRDDLDAHLMTGFDSSFDDLLERIAAVIPCVVEKDSVFLRWRYAGSSPQAPVTILGVKEGGALLGYAVMRVTPGRDGYLLDLMALPGRMDVARALARAVIVQGWRGRVRLLRYRFVDSSTSVSPDVLRRLGAVSRDGSRYTLPGLRSSKRHTLLVRLADERLQSMATDIRHWSYSVGDGEASFWVQ